jgi:CheY-like chemotaxis protein
MSAQQRTRFTIMLAEDNPGDVYLVREALQLKGLEVHLITVDDGEKALQYLDLVDSSDATARPQLLLLDLNLPKRSGDEILERLRSSPRCGGIPVVILTSSESPKDKADVARLGADVFFHKPANLDDFMKLGEVVQTMLEGN